MSRIPPIAENPKGLYRRYNVVKANGERTDPLAMYFVLRLDGLGQDMMHINACRIAARAYADAIQGWGLAAEHLQPVAKDLKTLLLNIEHFGK